MNKWHVWSVMGNRHNRIHEFLSNLQLIDVIEDFLYPVMRKEYSTKSGKRIKDLPIYANYIFINYDHCDITEEMIGSCPWISEYVGKCSDEEILRVKEQNNKSFAELVDVSTIKKGDVVKLISTPFAGWEADVVDVLDNKLMVSITILGSERVIKCSIDDVAIQEE